LSQRPAEDPARPWLPGVFLTQVRGAVRSLRRSPGFSLVAVLTLGLGIGLNVAIFSVVYGVLLRPLDLPEAGRLFTVWQSGDGGGEPERNLTSRGLFNDWRERNHSFAEIAAFIPFQVDATGAQLPENLEAAAVSQGYFSVFAVRPALGRGFLKSEETEGQHFVAVLSYGLWQRRTAGDPAILGKTIRLNDADYTVVGVMPASFRDPLNPDAEVWSPLPLVPSPEDRGHSYVHAVGRLAPGVSAVAARQDMNAVTAGLREEYPEALAGVGVELVPLRDTIVGPSRRLLLLLLGAVMVVLLATCANVGSLMMTRVSNRRQELALRSALGAGPGRLSGQIVAEGFVLGVASALVGLLLGFGGVALLRRLAPPQVPRVEAIYLDGPVFAYTLSVALAAGLVAAFLPAVRTWRRQPAQVLREAAGLGGSRADRRFRSGLIIGEIALGLVLLMGAGLLLETMANLSAVDPGFAVDGVVLGRISLSPSRFADEASMSAFLGRVEERLNSRPELEVAGTVSTPPPTSGQSPRSFELEGSSSRSSPPSALVRGVSPHFFAALDVPLVAGRRIAARDSRSASEVAMVNQAFVDRYFAGRSPLGRRLRMADDEEAGPRWRTIVGVAGNIRGLGIDQAPEPEVYLPTLQWPSRSMSVVARVDGSAESAFEAVRRAVAEAEPGQVVAGLTTMDERISRTLALRQFLAVLITGFAFVALVLIAIGTYGVISLAVDQRRRELAVRLAVGARRASVLGMVLLWSAVLTVTGVIVGLALAAAAGRTVSGFLFGVEPFDLTTATSMVLLLATVAFAASLVPALRAARTDPLEALKSP